ncbi:excinuclease ABC subunit UvrA [candidate division WOR-3 bacterium]|nr:excinuclease ABC subunit UvrA [candidate division WOR-3 bacterium]
MADRYIVVRKARVHNLKSIDLDIPRDKLVVVTGISGSGKSSLAFDTIYAEGQRRYVESLSTYARQFLGIMEKPDVESIEGLSPAISISQRKIARNPRSIVGTVTEIYDYMRLLFSRVATPYCPLCNERIFSFSTPEIIDRIMNYENDRKILINAPLKIADRKDLTKTLNSLRKKGFVRVFSSGKIFHLDEDKIEYTKSIKSSFSVVVDRIVTGPSLSRIRIAESVETALKESQGILCLYDLSDKKESAFSLTPVCLKCGVKLPKPEPKLFSFNSPAGACPECDGLGTKIEITPELVVPDEDLSILDGAILPIGNPEGKYIWGKLKKISLDFRFKMSEPFSGIPEDGKRAILYGVEEFFEGIIPNLERRYKQTESNMMRQEIEKYMSFSPCPECEGKRLKKEALSFRIKNNNITQISSLSVEAVREFFNTDLGFSSMQNKIAEAVLREIKARLDFMVEVGLNYISLDRRMDSLSGGEDQRVHLATQIGSGLVGVTYVLDEPSIGLHPRDTGRLLKTLLNLRNIGNNVIVVEHDRQIIESADYIVDLGPGAGREGGYVAAAGTYSELLRTKNPTGLYLSRKEVIPVPERRVENKGQFIRVTGAQENNLKDVDVVFPLGLFICVTGVSGSGKSSLVEQVLYKSLKKHFYPLSQDNPGKHRSIKGVENIDRVINIDQSPIGRTSRSNPATYTGVFTPIRELFAAVPESKARGYKIGRFSFNVSGGRCEKCEGQGSLRIEMHFLPDVFVTCDACGGKRFNQETLDIRYRNKNISEILELSVDEAKNFFSSFPDISKKLELLSSIGLGYLLLGQPAPELSGGEAQRLKLARELSKGGRDRTLYILDEPTTGLHFADIRVLLSVLNRLVDRGDSLIVVEHNLDIVKSADYIIDLGPEGGDKGGYVVAKGSPEEIISDKKSITGRYLKQELEA